MNEMKVFLIGENKTGTTSLKKAFKILNYKVCPEKFWYLNDLKHLYDFTSNKPEYFLSLTNNYEFFEDRPWNLKDFYKKIYSIYPDCKFILTERDPKNWLMSYRRWSIKVSLKTRKQYIIISNYLFGCDDWISLDDDKVINYYSNRNLEIKNFFENKNNLLIMDLEKGDGWEKLCNFLNIPTIQEPFPHLNRTK